MSIHRKGFTVIEVITCLAILGIVLALLLPNILDWEKKAKLMAEHPEGAVSIPFTMDAGASFIVLVDTYTGCQYLRNRMTGSMTPRMTREGRPMCPETAKRMLP